MCSNAAPQCTHVDVVRLRGSANAARRLNLAAQDCEQNWPCREGKTRKTRWQRRQVIVT